MVRRIDTPQAEFELGYWDIRGLAQPIRFLLAYAKAPFSEVRIGVNQDGSLIADEATDWEAHKHSLGVAFPNLPYLIDKSGPTEVRLTQSNAVLRYLARRFDLYGDSEAEQITIDVLQEEAYDFRNHIVKAVYTHRQKNRPKGHAPGLPSYPRVKSALGGIANIKRYAA